MRIQAIILARGGSKGIPNKNIIEFCGKPLIYWTIKQLQNSKFNFDIWVSSDCSHILEISKSYGASTIKRPKEISDDFSTSESAWLHAVKNIESKGVEFETIIAPQLTSPLRFSTDFDLAIEKFKKHKYDSLFTCCEMDNLFIWHNKENNIDGKYFSHLERPSRRQDSSQDYIENGSFYLFTKNSIVTNQSRHGLKRGKYIMPLWQIFEIDTEEDLEVCSKIMKTFINI